MPALVWHDFGGVQRGQAGSSQIWPAVASIWSCAVAGCSNPWSLVVQGASFHGLSVLRGGGLLTWVNVGFLPKPVKTTPAGAVYPLGGVVVMLTFPSRLQGESIFLVCPKQSMAARFVLYPFLKASSGGRLGRFV